MYYVLFVCLVLYTTSKFDSLFDYVSILKTTSLEHKSISVIKKNIIAIITVVFTILHYSNFIRLNFKTQISILSLITLNLKC